MARFKKLLLMLFEWAAVVAVAGIGAALYAWYTPARVSSPGQIAVIDFPQVLRYSQAGKAVTAWGNQQQQSLHDAAVAKLKEFKQMQTELENSRTSISAADFAAKSRDLQQQINDWNRQQQLRQADINKAITAAVQGIRVAVKDQLGLLARDQGIDAVLPAEQAFFVQPKLDLTPQVLRRLDQKLTKNDIHLPPQK